MPVSRSNEIWKLKPMSTEVVIRNVVTEQDSKLIPTLTSALGGARDRHGAKYWEAGAIEPTVLQSERVLFALGIWH